MHAKKYLFLKDKSFARILLFIICILPFFAGISSIPPLDRDESRFAQSSFQMIDNEDYINIKFQDEIRAKKPVGIYWLQAFSAKLFGTEEILSYRIPSLLAAFFSIVVIWYFSKSIFGRESSELITLLFASNLLFVTEAHIGKTDSFLLATICMQQLLLFIIYSNKKLNFYTNYIIPAIMWFFVSIGILIKGPVTILIFCLTIISFSILEKNYSIFIKIKPLVGIILISLIILPWVISIQSSTGGLFFEKAIMEDFVAKIISGQESHGGYPGYYIFISPLILWPIATFLPITVLFIKNNRSNTAIKFLLCWIIPFWIIIELVPTKLFHYPLPIIPAIAMLISASMIYFEKHKINFQSKKNKNLVFFISILFGIGGLVLNITLFYLAMNFSESKSIIIYIIIFLNFLLCLCLFFMTSYKNFVMIFNIENSSNLSKYFLNTKIIIILSALFYTGMFGYIIPNLKTIFPSNLIVNELKKIEYDSISSTGYYEPSLVFLLKGNLVHSNPNEAAIFLAEGQNNIVLVEKRSKEEFLASSRNFDLNLMEFKIIKGYNYSKGKLVEIFFYKNIN